jgi:hypothetical protein
MRTVILLLLKVLIGGALLVFILKRVPIAAAWTAVCGLSPQTVGVAIGLFLAAHLVNAFKLRVFLPQLTVVQALRFTFIALFYGTALPSQLAGDAVKALRMIRSLGQGDIGQIAAAVALDKVVGLFALLALTALGLGLEAKLMAADAARVVTSVVVLSAAMLAVLMLLPPPAWLGRWGQAFRLWREANVSAAVMSTALALGLLFNALSIGVFVVLGLGLGLHIGLAAWAVLVGMTSLILLLPITVAGVGLRDASLVGLLGSIGQDAHQALALSLALLALTVFGAVIGLVADVIGRDKN